MKKCFVILSLLLFSLGNVSAAENPVVVSDNVKQKFHNQKFQRDVAFEKRLGLTEEQKIKAKEIRIKGHDKLKPVIEELRSKKQEAKMVKMSRIAVEVQEERLAKLDKEIGDLEKKAAAIRKSNMKEFESILTRAQKKTLKEMKKEGRQRYHSQHPCPRPMIIPNQVKK